MIAQSLSYQEFKTRALASNSKIVIKEESSSAISLAFSINSIVFTTSFLKSSDDFTDYEETLIDLISSIDSESEILSKASTSIVTEKHDNIAITYITEGNGVGEVGAVVYSFKGTTVATLNLTYDSTGRLTGLNKVLPT